MYYCKQGNGSSGGNSGEKRSEGRIRAEKRKTYSPDNKTQFLNLVKEAYVINPKYKKKKEKRNKVMKKSTDQSVDKVSKGATSSLHSEISTRSNTNHLKVSKYSIKDTSQSYRIKDRNKNENKDLSTKDSWNYLNKLKKKKLGSFSSPKMHKSKNSKSKRAKYTAYLSSQSHLPQKKVVSNLKNFSRNKKLNQKSSKSISSKRKRGKRSLNLRKTRPKVESDLAQNSLFRNMSPVINRKILLDLQGKTSELTTEKSMKSQNFIENIPNTPQAQPEPDGYYSIDSHYKSNEILYPEEPEITPSPNSHFQSFTSPIDRMDVGPLLKDFEEMKLREEDLVHQLQAERNLNSDLHQTVKQQSEKLTESEALAEKLYTEIRQLKESNKDLNSQLERYQSRQDLDINHLETKNRLLTEALNKRNEDVKELEDGNEDLISLLEKCDDKIQKLQEKCGDFD